VGARVDVDALPRSAALARLPLALQRQCSLAGGDDYELCFTAPPDAREKVVAAGQLADVRVTRIGTIIALEPDVPERATPAIAWQDGTGAPLNLTLQGFDHFHAD
jgi:thiamine-monophosphate kinase